MAQRMNLSDSQLVKLRERNKLLDVLENVGQQIVVVGDTSSGKSTTINFLLGYPFNWVAQGVGTRRPCVITLTPDEDCSQVVFRVRFHKNDHMEEKELTKVSDVAQFVQAVNDPFAHPDWFDCLRPDTMGPGGSPRGGQGIAMPKAEDAFDETPAYVQMLHKEINFPMRLVDVPGLTRGNRLPTQIALSYIKPDNAVILVIGKDHPNNGGFPHLASAMRQCPRTIFVQNFAGTKIQDNQVMENYHVIAEKMEGGTKDPVLYCVDYGKPWEPSNQALWEKGVDQEDWHKITAEKGVEAVRRAMSDHADKRSNQLTERFKSGNVFSNTIVAGLAPVRERLDHFQFQDIDGHIKSLQGEVKKEIAKKQKELKRAEGRLKQLQHPPEWDAMLSAFASCIRKYLDATFAATPLVDEPVDRTARDYGVRDIQRRSQVPHGDYFDQESGTLLTTEEEASTVASTSMDERILRKDVSEKSLRANLNSPNSRVGLRIRSIDEDMKSKGGYDRQTSSGPTEPPYWFNKDVDKKIVKLLKDFCGFEADLKIACIRSWQRLSDEFVGMLAFAPMPCVPASVHDMAKMRVGGGQSGQLNFTEEAVRIVMCLEQAPGVGLVRPLLEHFERRMRHLVDRDYKAAISMLESHCSEELSKFFDLIREEAEGSDAEMGSLADRRPQLTKQILEGTLTALLDHADKVLRKTLQGEAELDVAGDVIIDSVTQRPRMLERSGMMVRVAENSTAPGPLHWMLPFKFNNFSGQISLRSVSFTDRTRGKRLGGLIMRCCDKQGDDYRVESGETPEMNWTSNLLEEIELKMAEGTPTINCCNAVNLRLYRLCTEDYEVPVSASAGETQYDVEVLKLLKALQIELASAWAAMWRGMVQELSDVERMRGFVAQKLSRNSGSDKELEAQARAAGLDSFADAPRPRQHNFGPVMSAVESVVSILSGSRAATADMMTTEEEIRKAGEDAKWPDHAAYVSLLEKLTPNHVKTAFIINKDLRLAGQPSWLRLCDELVFVILQLQMKRVSPEELSMVRASAGTTHVAGQQEIISKLALHRMSQLNLHSQQVFRCRFDFLYRRDVKSGFANLDSNAAGLRDFYIDGMPAMCWLEGQMLDYKNMVVDGALATLEAKFQGLQPFDFTILNGRFPLKNGKMRKQHFELQPGGTSVKKFDTAASIRQMWSLPRYSARQSVEAWSHSTHKPGVLQLSIEGTRTAYENFQEQRESVEQIFNLPCESPPAKDYAGGAFQELCLKFFKGIHVDAIHYCRPKLKAMMARLYQEDDLRRALQESDALDYLKDFGGHIMERQRLKVQSLRGKVRAMEAVLHEASRQSP